MNRSLAAFGNNPDGSVNLPRRSENRRGGITVNRSKWYAFVYPVAILVALTSGCGGGGPEGEGADGGGTAGGIMIVVLGDVQAGDDTASAAQQAFGGASSVVFERHYTAAVGTGGALRAMLTGYPVSALDGVDAGDAERPSLAELFARMDYYPFGVVAGNESLLGSGVERGFEDWRFDATASLDDWIAQVLEAIERAPGAYLGLVYRANADRSAVEALTVALREAGAFENTTFVVTADHGPEEEGGGEAFDALLRERVIHVPLVVRFPEGAKPETLAPRTTSLTSGLDILPSLLALAGRDISGALPGSNILDGDFTGHTLVEAGDAWAFLQDKFKIVVSGEKALVFDLDADPQAQHDLAAEMRDRSRELLAAAIKTRAAMVSGQPGEVEGEEGLDPETLEHLRSLGYVQ
jgi:arylsulfatase A-like enzyme